MATSGTSARDPRSRRLPARLRRRLGHYIPCRSTSPKVFSPDPDEVAFAKKVIEAIPDGAGVHMIDGKMQDDATWKQCRVMVDLAELLAAKDAAAAYGMAGTPA